MIRDITLGQYYPGKSPLHRLDPRLKIIGTFLFIIEIFLVKNLVGFVLCILAVALVVKLSKVPFSFIMRGLKPILMILIFTFVLNMFMIDGKVLWQWGFLKLTDNGIYTALFMSIRLILLIIGSSLLTLTTKPIVLTDGMESLMIPLKKIGLPAHEIAMMMSIALRFIPTLTEETDKIMKAQQARGADFESGNIFKRAKAMIPILVPLFISAFRIAQDLAMAMEARCYRGGVGRTKLKVMTFGKIDIYGSLFLAGFLILVILERVYL